MSTSTVRSQPCAACPYRRDVPSGVWADHEYDKLVGYDLPTGMQPPMTFGCHATPEHYCHGWAVVHSNRGHGNELLALRLASFGGDEVVIPEAGVPLFSSGAEAAEHGKAEIEEPGEEACETIDRLGRKYARLTRLPGES